MNECKESQVKVYSDKTEWRNLEGELHRENGPAIEYASGYKEWCINGNLHNENGPAVEYPDGYKAWFLNGKHHNEKGPAIEYADGSKAWYINGKNHREDGPAVEYANGNKCWYLNDIKYSEADWKKEVENLKNKTQSNAGKVVIVDGKEYILTEKH